MCNMGGKFSKSGSYNLQKLEQKYKKKKGLTLEDRASSFTCLSEAQVYEDEIKTPNPELFVRHQTLENLYDNHSVTNVQENDEVAPAKRISLAFNPATSERDDYSSPDDEKIYENILEDHESNTTAFGSPMSSNFEEQIVRRSSTQNTNPTPVKTEEKEKRKTWNKPGNQDREQYFNISDESYSKSSSENHYEVAEDPLGKNWTNPLNGTFWTNEDQYGQVVLPTKVDVEQNLYAEDRINNKNEKQLQINSEVQHHLTRSNHSEEQIEQNEYHEDWTINQNEEEFPIIEIKNKVVINFQIQDRQTEEEIEQGWYKDDRTVNSHEEQVLITETRKNDIRNSLTQSRQRESKHKPNEEDFLLNKHEENGSNSATNFINQSSQEEENVEQHKCKEDLIIWNNEEKEPIINIKDTEVKNSILHNAETNFTKLAEDQTNESQLEVLYQSILLPNRKISYRFEDNANNPDKKVTFQIEEEQVEFATTTHNEQEERQKRNNSCDLKSNDYNSDDETTQTHKPLTKSISVNSDIYYVIAEDGLVLESESEEQESFYDAEDFEELDIEAQIEISNEAQVEIFNRVEIDDEDVSIKKAKFETKLLGEEDEHKYENMETQEKVKNLRTNRKEITAKEEDELVETAKIETETLSGDHEQSHEENEAQIETKDSKTRNEAMTTKKEEILDIINVETNFQEEDAKVQGGKAAQKTQHEEMNREAIITVQENETVKIKTKIQGENDKQNQEDNTAQEKVDNLKTNDEEMTTTIEEKTIEILNARTKLLEEDGDVQDGKKSQKTENSRAIDEETKNTENHLTIEEFEEEHLKYDLVEVKENINEASAQIDKTISEKMSNSKENYLIVFDEDQNELKLPQSEDIPMSLTLNQIPVNPNSKNNFHEKLLVAISNLPDEDEEFKASNDNNHEVSNTSKELENNSVLDESFNNQTHENIFKKAEDNQLTLINVSDEVVSTSKNEDFSQQLQETQESDQTDMSQMEIVPTSEVNPDNLLSFTDKHEHELDISKRRAPGGTQEDSAINSENVLTQKALKPLPKDKMSKNTSSQSLIILIEGKANESEFSDTKTPLSPQTIFPIDEAPLGYAQVSEDGSFIQGNDELKRNINPTENKQLNRLKLEEIEIFSEPIKHESSAEVHHTSSVEDEHEDEDRNVASNKPTNLLVAHDEQRITSTKHQEDTNEKLFNVPSSITTPEETAKNQMKLWEEQDDAQIEEIISEINVIITSIDKARSQINNLGTTEKDKEIHGEMYQTLIKIMREVNTINNHNFNERVIELQHSALNDVHECLKKLQLKNMT